MDLKYFFIIFLQSENDIPVFRHSGVPAFRCSGIQVFRHSGVPAFRCSGIPSFTTCQISQGESLNFSAPKIFRIHVKLHQNLRQENCCEKICGFWKYPKFSPNFRNLAFHSSQIIISNILIHKCLIASPNLCQIVAPNGSLGSFCAKSIFAINLRQKCAPNFVRVAVLRRRSFGNTPSNSPWEKCTS